MMDFATLIESCAPWVAHATLAALVGTESAYQPWAIGINGGHTLTRQPRTQDEAVASAKTLIARGYNIDLGLGQLNSATLARIGLPVEQAFDPCTNIAVAATLLATHYDTARTRGMEEQAALHAALSAYNTGSMTRGFTNGYVQRVLRHAGPDPSGPFPVATHLPAVRPAALHSITQGTRTDKQKTAPARGPPAAQVEHSAPATDSVLVY